MEVFLDNVIVNLPGTKKKLFAIKELKISSGSRVIIKGPSGIGKTTLLHLIAGLFKPDAGIVFLDEYNLNLLSDSARSLFRRKNIGIIFQKLNLLDHLTISENVELSLTNSNSKKEIISKALKEVKMDKIENERASNLSLGEQQRVAVARVIAANPKLILADEPTSSLDEINASHIIDSLLTFPESTTIITVSHDERIIKKFNSILDFEKIIK